MRRDLSALQPPRRGAGLAGALPPAPQTAFARSEALEDEGLSTTRAQPEARDGDTVSSRGDDPRDPRNRPIVLYSPALLAQRLATIKERTGNSYAELVLAAFDAHHDMVEGQLLPPRRSALPPARTRRRRAVNGMRSIQFRLSALELSVIDQVADQKHLSRSVLLSAVLQQYVDAIGSPHRCHGSK